jgi:hypothetical protein
MLSGCSKSDVPTPSYDPVELIEYQNCLNAYLQQYGNQSVAIEFCKSKKPKLK